MRSASNYPPNTHGLFRIDTRAFLIAITLLLFGLGSTVLFSPQTQAQNSFPAPPTDRTRIYFINSTNSLEPLPFEAGTTPLKTDRVAGNDKTSYIEVKGSSALSAISNASPRFYLFVVDGANVHPPFIVHLTQKKGARRVTAMAQKGLMGFAIYSEEIVKPHYRVLSRADGALYMEISPRESLAPGEYAIIGSDLERIATFRIATASNG